MRLAVLAAGQWTDTPADTGNVIREILFGLCQQHPTHTFLLVTKKTPDTTGLPANAQSWVIAPTLNRYYWEEWQLPRGLKKEKIDLLFSMNELVPLRSKVPVILLVTHTRWLEKQDAKKTAEYLQKAQQIITLSEAVRAALVAAVPEVADKIKVIRPGQDAGYQPLEWDERQGVKQAHAGGTEYFLATGTIDPRNNTMPLLKAFSILKKRLRSNVKLILAGEVTPAGKEVTDSLAAFRFREDVIWLPHVNTATLASLTAGAYGLVYTNRHDGLALPVHAALHCAVPVVAYEGSGAREAGGPAVLYADPNQADDLAEKLISLYKDESLRTRYLATVLDVAHLPSWSHTVEEVGKILGLEHN